MLTYLPSGAQAKVVDHARQQARGLRAAVMPG